MQVLGSKSKGVIMNDKVLLVEKQDGVAVLTLNRQR